MLHAVLLPLRHHVLNLEDSNAQKSSLNVAGRAVRLAVDMQREGQRLQLETVFDGKVLFGRKQVEFDAKKDPAVPLTFLISMLIFMRTSTCEYQRTRLVLNLSIGSKPKLLLQR